MKYRLETATLEVVESDDFSVIMDAYYRYVDWKEAATVYADGEVFLEYVPERYK